MGVFDFALSCLNNIVSDDATFSIAISSTCRQNNLNPNVRKDLSSLVGCALRHYLILDYRFSLISKEKELTNVFILATSNLLFAKKVDKEKTIDFLNKSFVDENLRNSVIDLIENLLNGDSLIPESFNKNSLEFLSFRFNTPIWLVKMWRKHYGYRTMRLILSSNSKHFTNFAKINGERIDSDQFEIQNPSFSSTNHEGFYHFDENNGIKKTAAYLNKQIYIYPFILDSIIKESDVDNLRGIAAYASTPTNLISALASNLSSYFSMDFLLGQQQAYFDVKNQKEHYNLKNVHLYEGNYSNLITCISKKVHTMFVIPENSNFFLLRNSPDYFIRFKQSSLDSLIENEYKALEESSTFVEDGGFLTYIIQTISEKESHGIINKFLLNHNDFMLIKDEQIFPFTEHETSLFYAILKKEDEHD